jgi:hypothetical protein
MVARARTLNSSSGQFPVHEPSLNPTKSMASLYRKVTHLGSRFPHIPFLDLQLGMLRSLIGIPGARGTRTLSRDLAGSQNQRSDAVSGVGVPWNDTVGFPWSPSWCPGDGVMPVRKPGLLSSRLAVRHM